jgi:uncharacterized protein
MKNKIIKNNSIVSICMMLAILATTIFADQTIQPNILQPIKIPSLLQIIENSPNAPSIPQQAQSPQQQSTTPTPLDSTAQIQARQPYKVELSVSSESEKERRQSFIKALDQLLIQISDNPKITVSPTIKTALSNPSIYIQRYTYVSHKTGVDQQALSLQIQFDQAAITKLLQQTQAMQTEQTTNRPQTLIWLVKIASGNKIMEYESSNDVVVPILKKVAQDSGMPIVLPTLDLQDVDLITAEDICNLNITTIKNASQRYGTHAIAAGCMRQPIVGNLWTSQWLLLYDNKSESFNFAGITAEDVITQAMRAIAPNLTATTKQSVSQSNKLILRITNVNGLDQYNEVVRYLSAFSQISQVDLVKISATEVELSINIVGDQQALLETLSSQNKLVFNTNITVSPPGVDLDYKWIPINNEQPQTISIKPLP